LSIRGHAVFFALAQESKVRLSVYDPAGRLILTPLDGLAKAGEHSVSLDGLRNGIYMVELIVDGKRLVGRAIIR